MNDKLVPPHVREADARLAAQEAERAERIERGKEWEAEIAGENDRLLRAREVAAKLDCSTATVMDRWQAGEIPGFRLWGRKGGPVRFRESEIDALIESWRANDYPAGDEK